jgi:uncharacterized protein YlxW (UPF0749 family)
VSSERPPRPRLWRLTTFAVAIGAGGLFVTTGLNSHGLDLRAASVTDLASVVGQERARTDQLQGQVADLNRQVTALTQRVGDTRVERLQGEVDALKGPAGLQAVHGPGVAVTLDDAPKKYIDSYVASGELTADELVVHQQDIQAVANALWAGGAEAMTLQGQRVVSTTGIKCVGNTVILHGVPYSPPYVIAAIGSPEALQAALDASAYVSAYRVLTRFHLGYAVRVGDDLRMPAYGGPLALHYARAASATQPRG